MDAQFLATQLLNGLANGLIYFLIAAGFTVVFGLMDFVNFAHGSFFLLGAYTALELTRRGQSFWLALVVAPIVVGVIAWLIERVLLRRMYGMAHMYQIVATFALALGIQELATLIWGPYEFALRAPEPFGGTLSMLGISYPTYRVLVVTVSALLALGLWLLLERTRFGAMLRAGSENTDMTSSLGINVFRLFGMTFAGAGALAAVVGVLSTPLRSVNPHTGSEILMLAVVVVVVGSIGNYVGAFIAALVIAEVQALAVVVAPRAADVLIYVLMAVVLLLRSEAVRGRLARA